jgi:peptide chain release factor 2
VETLHLLAREEGDETQEPDIAQQVGALTRRLGAQELRSLFAGEYDENDAICEVHAGEGGTDAQDWAEMLLRMYSRWAEGRGFAVEIDEVSPGKEAGLLSATFIIKGRYAYGLMRSEQGVHRLVRMSPFDAASRRQTSFASVDVTPFTDDASGEVDLDEKDLRIDTYRSSGAGGQHVNVTDSAVRITHLPTGVVVSCQNERSQTQNKARAMQVLVAKLIERQREERRAELEGISGTAGPAAMGNQIRSYVQHPYQQVKDLRTGHVTGNVQAVLEGDLDPFIEAFLRWERGSAAS